MAFMVLPVRENTRFQLAMIILAGSLAVAAANYFLFSNADSFVWALHKASDGWINANLTIFAPMTALVIGALVMGWGGQRLPDLGLSGGWVARLAVYLGAGWLAVQALAVIGAVISAGATGAAIALHPAWEEFGAGTLIGLFIAMVLGTALFEDGLFRGYVLPQIQFALGDRIAGERARALTALALCAVIFALWHLPTILLNREVSAGAVAGALAYMALGGIMLGLLYLRTGRLELAIAGHALVNAPTLVVASPVPGSALAGLVGLGAIIAGPVLAGQRWSLDLVRFEPR